MKGRPAINPRIDDLEKRIAVLEKQIAAMNESFARGAMPRPGYESQFTVWPGASSNGIR